MKNIFLFFALLLCAFQPLPAKTHRVLFGTATSGNGDSQGIYMATFDSDSGMLSGPVKLVARLDQPGFLAQHPLKSVIYVVGTAPDTKDNVIASYVLGSKADEGTLQNLNAVRTDCSPGTHLTVHRSGKWLATAHYGSGCVAVYSLRDDGRIHEHTAMVQLRAGSMVNPKRQEKAHPHYVSFDPSGTFLLVPDLGADSIHIFSFDQKSGSLSPHKEIKTRPGAGPRHLKFSPDHRFVYVLNELSMTVESFEWDAKSGSMSRVGTVKTLPEEIEEREMQNAASEIRVSPDGFYVYTANRGNDSISAFKADPYTGRLELIQIIPARAAWPRNFNIDPTGRWLICAGQDSSNAGAFRIDPEFGTLQYRPKSSIIVPNPICVLFPR